MMNQAFSLRFLGRHPTQDDALRDDESGLQPATARPLDPSTSTTPQPHRKRFAVDSNHLRVISRDMVSPADLPSRKKQ
jgi:hypothetical protein